MKILVVDDDVVSRKALRNILKELGGETTVLEAPDSREAMRLIEEHPDLGLVVLDLNLPERDGFSVLSELRVRHPAISVVVISALQDHDIVKKALNRGALAFIPKSATREVMLSALQLVLAGGVYIPPEVLFRKQAGDGDLPEAPAPAVPPSPTRGLGPQGEAARVVPEEP
jgi:DNA-binding NarL/FixJ family response regulator